MDALTGEPTAERILRAAVRLFAQKGYSATATREIIAAAGVTQPMLYYYFGNKEGLCRAALNGFIGALHARLRALLDAPDPGDGRGFLVKVVWSHLQYLKEHEDFARLLHALFFGPENESKVFDFSKCVDEGAALLIGLVRKANRRKLVRPNRELDFTIALRGQMFIHVVAYLRDRAPLEVETAGRIVDDLLDGFACSPRSRRPRTKRRPNPRKAVIR